MLFDTHSHCYFGELLPKIDEVFAQMEAYGITRNVQIGCDITSSLAAIELAKRFPGTSASVGFHPVDAQNSAVERDRLTGELGNREQTNDEIEKELYEIVLANRDTVVAIGETGLDFYHLSEDKEKAKEEFKEQLEWFERLTGVAKRTDLPLIIHTRNAPKETIECIRKWEIKRAVIHCFSENWKFAKELIEFSDEIYFSFSGILTYKNALSIQDAASRIPLNRILIETDAPFLSPTPVRSEVNQPANVRYILEKLQSLRSETPEEIEKTVFENSLRFYGIA